MATSTINRADIGTNDTGTGTNGTVVDTSYVALAIYDKIDALIAAQLNFGSHVSVPATKKIFVDGGGDTYWIETTGNQVDQFVGATNIGRFTATANASLVDFSVTGATTLSSTLGVTGLITSTGGITGGAASHTTGAFSGIITVSGFGAHSFSASGTGPNYLTVRNPTAGVSNYGLLETASDIVTGAFLSTSSTYTAANQIPQAGSSLQTNGSGGLSIAATNASGAIRFYSGGTTLRMSISSAGAVTMPTQPAFLATATASQNNVTGDGTSYTVLWGTEVFDQASNFASPTFTAPVTGRYQLNVTVGLSGLLTTHTNAYIQLTTSNRSYINQIQRATNFIADDTVFLTLSVLADMDAGDTASVTTYVSNATKVVDILATYSTFSGYLAC